LKRAGRGRRVPSEELDPILIQVTVPLPTPMIFAGLTEPAHLAQWLCDRADVDLRIGGRYALHFTGDPTFTSAGHITHLAPDVEIGFTWLAPPAYATLMNLPEPKTHVYVRLQESPEGIDVTLEHNGWGSGDAWEEARSWHFHLWDGRLHDFKEHLLKAAYG
jgi:uncharacterized protein YndB with AHSA1/START domain